MKEFKITEEQIKENKDLTLKEYFKEVFEENFTGYKTHSNGWIGYFENSIMKYYIDMYGFFGYPKDVVELKKCDYERDATEQEVFDALKKEAEKRGYKKGVSFISEDSEEVTTLDEDINFSIKHNCLFVGKRDFTGVIFEKGKWAEIISQPEEIIELNGVKYKRID